MRAVLAGGDCERACRLALQGNGQARDLAREYTFMSRGLGITLHVMMGLLMQEVGAGDIAADTAAHDDLITLLVKLLASLTPGASGEQPHAVEPATPASLADACEQALGTSLQTFQADQAQRAAAVVQALRSGQANGAWEALAELDAKDEAWLRLHDPMVRFMADAMAWFLNHRGPEALLIYHLATAEGQRAGFDKWEQMSAREFAATTAFLLQQHMGRVHAEEDDEKFTIHQSPCGSGGRLRLMGAYQGAHALPLVQGESPLTFGQPSVPAYCSHCAIWNGTATLRWYGRAQWVFSAPARTDGGCTLHIYKRREDAPADYTRRVAWPVAQGKERP
jgi:hypothetical protein